MEEKLAIQGGPKVYNGVWPNWPQSSEKTRHNVDAVLESHRWSISGPYRGQISWEERFGYKFAEFTGATYCVPASTGSASLSIALEACGVGAHDEVIVPGLSWVASASVVLGVNAVPILTDVDYATGCLDPRAVEHAITSRTRAISVVHLGSAIADLDRLVAIADTHSIPLIEDCAQAHGAFYAGGHVGRFGTAGTFSMQHSKLLTSGEGGAVITDDATIANRLHHLRADGRTICKLPPETDHMALEETAEIMGTNYCLSEFHAAILLAQLEELNKQNIYRSRNAALLDSFLIPLGFCPQATAAQTTARAYYTYVVRLPDDIIAKYGAEPFAKALSAELGLPCKTMYSALNNSRLYNPSSRARFNLSESFKKRVDPARYYLPTAEGYARSCIALPHRMLLADPGDMEYVSHAFAKVCKLIYSYEHATKRSFV
jgi:dTDP-4-amino-4,6-dideoxygalactose transaminase